MGRKLFYSGVFAILLPLVLCAGSCNKADEGLWIPDPGTSSKTNTGDDNAPITFSESLCSDIGQTPIVLAYYTENSKELPDPTLLTHINYAHGRFKNPKTGDGGIEIADVDLMKKVIALKEKNPNLKVLLMIGGWGQKADGFSMMARDLDKRKAFCESCKSHLDKYGLDGVDIDWEYPTYPAEGNGAIQADTQNFNLLLRELRQTIGNEKLITFASSSSAKYVDWKTAILYIDYVNVMTYDMGSAPERHNSPLYRSDTFNQTSCDESIGLHVAAGIPLKRQVLGVPFYGKAYKGGDEKYPDETYKIYDYEVKYNEMADIFKGTYHGKDVNGKNIRHWDDVAKVPYLTDEDGHILLCYDDPESVELKGKYVGTKGILGAMFWEYRHDDSDHSLLKALVKGVYGKDSVIQ